MYARTIAIFALTLLCTAASGQGSDAAPARSQAPEIEVCFVLDTTGSMGGLIEGAKQKIWSIVNEMAKAEPTPNVRVGLVGYRDRGDAYVTRIHDLTDDIDAVYGHLQAFQAQGGGDGPESVNQALHEAVHKVSWSAGDEVLKIVFLVGDAPPHMDYDNDVKYPETCQQAARKGLIVNTIQCGSMGDTTPIWKEIARRSEGAYAAIGQTGDMRIASTPMDGRLSELNAALGKTLMAYGAEPARKIVAGKQVAAEAAPAAVAADRMAYNAATGGKVVQGKGDLVEDLEAGEVELGALAFDELPEPLKGKSVSEQQEIVKASKEEREKLQKVVDELLKQRADYLEKQAAEEGPDSFDEEVARMIREQAARKGIEYEK